MPAKPASKPSDEIMTVANLAQYLHCHQSTIYRLLKDEKLPAFKIGGGWRFQRSAIDQWARKAQVRPEL